MTWTAFLHKGWLCVLAVALAACADDVVEGTTRVRVDHHPGEPKVERAKHTQVYRDGRWLHHGPAEYFDKQGDAEGFGTYADGLEQGHWVLHTEDGMRSEGEFRAGRREGVWTWYHPTGKVGLTGTYVDDARHGEWTTHDPSGRIQERATWKHGVRHGSMLIYDTQGHVLETVRYVEGVRAE